MRFVNVIFWNGFVLIFVFDVNLCYMYIWKNTLFEYYFIRLLFLFKML